MEEVSSRLLECLGFDAVERVRKLDVLVIGATGLGVEAAKCLILSGVHSVTLHDDSRVQPADLGANFCLRESDVGALSRAVACAPRLAALNKHVSVRPHTGVAVDAGLLGGHTAVLCVDQPLADAMHFNDICRSVGVAFVGAESRGAAGYVFVDFGADFTVGAADDRTPISAAVQGVSQAQLAQVTLAPGPVREFSAEGDGGGGGGGGDDEDGNGYGFAVDDYITLRDIRGVPNDKGVAPWAPMSKLNEKAAMRITEVEGDVLTIDCDTLQLGAYAGGGLATQASRSRKPTHRPLRSCVLAPPLACCGPAGVDGPQRDRAAQLHAAFRGLHAFAEAHQVLTSAFSVFYLLTTHSRFPSHLSTCCCQPGAALAEQRGARGRGGAARGALRRRVGAGARGGRRRRRSGGVLRERGDRAVAGGWRGRRRGAAARARRRDGAAARVEGARRRGGDGSAQERAAVGAALPVLVL
jgi:molybdopterin/thiamine biosynthesis adenylyltransferase